MKRNLNVSQLPEIITSIYDELEKINNTQGSLNAGFPSVIYPNAFKTDLVAGSNIIYTVPKGRKAIMYDYIVTNVSGATISNYPELKIGNTYYRLGSVMNENTNGFGHNYAMSSVKNSSPIVLNENESISINCSGIGLTVWGNIVEFDKSSSIQRADITNFVVGANTLLSVKGRKGITSGQIGMSTSSNLPNCNYNGFAYFNNSGATVNISSINIVPNGGIVEAKNTFVTTNAILNGAGFTKFFHGNLNQGDSIVITVDSAAPGQFMWLNYIEV